MWYSDRWSPKAKFSSPVRKRLLTYFQRGIPPASGSPRKRLPSIRSRVAGRDGGDERRDARRVVLVVGVEHHDDVGAGRERRVVARLLVAAVAPVLAVDDDVEAELPGDLDRLVARHVVDQDDLVDEVVRDVGVRPLERPGGVVGGHHDDERAGWRWPRTWASREGYRSTGRVPVTGPSYACERISSAAHRFEERPAHVRTTLRHPRPDPAIAERIPPGQYKTDKFPVLHYGSVPHIDLATWDFKVWGEVDAPFTLTWQQFKELPRKTIETDIHCVTRWTKLDTTWEGVAIQTILEMAGVRPTATHVVSHAEQGYTANVPLSVLDDDDVLLADTFGGAPLEPEHGYPLRLVIPKRYFWKSSKWIRGLEFLDHDQLGFWERYGYNNDADPWKEERFSEVAAWAQGPERGHARPASVPPGTVF